MPYTGFSTEALQKTDIPFKERIKLFSSLKVDAIELCFDSLKALEEFELSSEIMTAIQKNNFITIHSPYISKNNEGNIIKKLKELYKKMPIVQGVVIHPDRIDNFLKWEKTGLPILIENMDKNKKIGTHPKYFQKLKENYNFGFVLDLQHAYEHDSTMKLAQELIEVMADKLSHLHISGCNKNDIHCPLYSADNKKEITKILKLNINVPKILEGHLTENILKNITKELTFVSNYEQV